MKKVYELLMKDVVVANFDLGFGYVEEVELPIIMAESFIQEMAEESGGIEKITLSSDYFEDLNKEINIHDLLLINDVLSEIAEYELAHILSFIEITGYDLMELSRSVLSDSLFFKDKEDITIGKEFFTKSEYGYIMI